MKILVYMSNTKNNSIINFYIYLNQYFFINFLRLYSNKYRNKINKHMYIGRTINSFMLFV